MSTKELSGGPDDGVADKPQIKEDGTVDVTGPVFCDSCQFSTGGEVKAKHICIECGPLHFCGACFEVHSQNQATKEHDVTFLKITEPISGPSCKTHTRLLKDYYCSTCLEPVCQLCIFFDHGSHEIKKLDGVSSVVVDEMNAEQKSFCEGMLRNMKMAATKKKDAIIKSVETQAESWINQIIQQKEEFIEKVEANFKGIFEVTVNLENIPPLTNRLDASTYQKEFNILWQNMPEFVPTKETCNLGSLESKNKTLQRVDKGEYIFDEKYNAKYDVDDEAMFIPSVANLGNDFYAVAHPTLEGQPSGAIDVYKVPGELQQTIRDHVSPLYDMTSTPFGLIAVLSDGTTEGTCSVKIFYPEAGYIRSTKDLHVHGHPVSFDVDPFHQFVILSDDEGKRVCKAFSEDGTEMFTHEIDEENDVKDACRISCSVRFVYILGPQKFCVYERKGKLLVEVTESVEYSYIDTAI